jgi:HlyD family secretion protein
MDRIVENKHFIKPKYWGIIIVAVIVLSGAMFLGFSDHTRRMSIEKDKVTVETVFNGRFNDYIQLSGQAALMPLKVAGLKRSSLKRAAWSKKVRPF